jgi:hypothetical protein
LSGSSGDIEAHRKDGLHVVDGAQATVAGEGSPPSYSEGRISTIRTFSSRDTPMALHDRALVEAALFPPTSTVLTFVYCARHAKAPFGLSWLNFKELTRDPLCLEEKQFGRWLRSQERKKA